MSTTPQKNQNCGPCLPAEHVPGRTVSAYQMAHSIQTALLISVEYRSG
ncbi:hypothetical protein D1AOALGA4SA_791 [Olavius algarvensis Delta 1 endosymbiont]|nr:hypothetical protein D1AOALGA4SA_791 [Olavius algarvensis Delta 1 endosymbiont]